VANSKRSRGPTLKTELVQTRARQLQDRLSCTVDGSENWFQQVGGRSSRQEKGFSREKGVLDQGSAFAQVEVEQAVVGAARDAQALLVKVEHVEVPLASVEGA